MGKASQVSERSQATKSCAASTPTARNGKTEYPVPSPATLATSKEMQRRARELTLPELVALATGL